MTQYPRFGCLGAVEQETHGFLTDQLEYVDGFHTDLFSLKFSDTLRRSAPSFCAHTYGIGEAGDPTRNNLAVPLDTVTMVETEEATTPHMLATQPNVSPSLGQKLTYTDGLIFFRKKITITINGRGGEGQLPLGLTEEDRGKTFDGAIILLPAVGDLPVIQDSASFYVARVEINKTITDWQKFTIELTKYIGNTVALAQKNMIQTTLFTKDELDLISLWYQITRTTTLNSKDKANVEESINIFDANPSA